MNVPILMRKRIRSPSVEPLVTVFSNHLTVQRASLSVAHGLRRGQVEGAWADALIRGQRFARPHPAPINAAEPAQLTCTRGASCLLPRPTRGINYLSLALTTAPGMKF